jgi:hypothetical protein
MAYVGASDFTNGTNGAYSATETKLTFHHYDINTSSASIDIFNPFNASKKTHGMGVVRGGNASADTFGTFGLLMTSAKSHTGFNIYPSTGTMTGNYYVYGYRS